MTPHAYEIASDQDCDSFRVVRQPGDLADDPLLAAFFSYWQVLAAGRPMPLVGDVDPVEMPPQVLPHVALVEVVRDDGRLRFRTRLMGGQATDQIGESATGKFVDELSGGEGVQARFERVTLTGEPYTADIRLTWSSRNYKRYRVVICPLAASEQPERVDRLLGILLFR